MRRFVLSLDGLSFDDFQALLLMLPKSREKLSRAASSTLDAGCFAQAPKAVWAELLTGKRWYNNGCAGHSRPQGTLNRLRVISERDLQSPIRLTKPADQSLPDATILINIPLLYPTPGNRLWFSDGGLLTNKSVSPSELAQNEPFSLYKPRPFADLADGFHSFETSLSRCFEIDANRIDCAEALLGQNRWSSCWLRLTAFDHLTHLLGMNYMADGDWYLHSRLKQLAERLDEVLAAVMADEVDWLIVSCFSHISCTAKVNLNEILCEEDILSVSPVSELAVQRTKAVESGAKRHVNASGLASLDGRIDTASSKAASPVSGCVYVNASDKFADGIVTPSQFAVVKEQVQSALVRRLGNRFGAPLQLELNLSHSSSHAPDMVLAIEGVEFHNNDSRSPSTSKQLPLTTHSARGFVVGLRGAIGARSVTPVEVFEILNCGTVNA